MELGSRPHSMPALSYLTRAILAPNAQIDSYNEKILQRVPSQCRHYMSTDCLQLEGRSDIDDNACAIPYSSVLDDAVAYAMTFNSCQSRFSDKASVSFLSSSVLGRGTLRVS